MTPQNHQSHMAEAIETTRLLLRRPRERDVERLSKLWCDEQVQRFMGGVLPSQDAAMLMLNIVQQWNKNKAGLWAVCERAHGDLIGICGFGTFEEETEIIYKLFPTYWGHGYALEAATSCLTYGFRTWQLEKILGVTQEANQRSQHVLEKLGMRYIRSVWKWEATQRIYEIKSTDENPCNFSEPRVF